MPRRPRARQPRPEVKPPRPGASRSSTNVGRASGSAAGRPSGTGATILGGTNRSSFVEDPGGSGMAELRRIQPYQATKTYVCPGCNQEIRPGTGHVVIVPLTDPAGRRHWHSPCWEHRGNRRTTGR